MNCRCWFRNIWLLGNDQKVLNSLFQYMIDHNRLLKYQAMKHNKIEEEIGWKKYHIEERLMMLARSLPILFIFSKVHLSDSLIFLFFVLFIFSLIFTISFLLLTPGFAYFSFSHCFSWSIRFLSFSLFWWVGLYL